jgi:hypothetical protein
MGITPNAATIPTDKDDDDIRNVNFFGALSLIV